MKRLIFLVALGLAGSLFVRHYLIEGIYLKTDSMSPTLPQGAHVFVNKAAYFFRSPHRGEIIQFHTPQQPDANKDLVKRVIAIEGDTIETRGKEIYLNNKVLNEPYVQHIHPDDNFITDHHPNIEVPKGCVFVMGDNRDVSGDSRDWKDANDNWSPFVCNDSLQGRVLAGDE